MTRYLCTAYVNVSPDSFRGYHPDHPLRRVDDFEVEAGNPAEAAENTWAIASGKGTRADVNGKWYPVYVPSLYAGDVVAVRSAVDGYTRFACTLDGWDELRSLPNPVGDWGAPLTTGSE